MILLLWRVLGGGVLGGALAVAVCVVWPVTVIEASMAGVVLTMAGIAAGAVLDVRADRRRDTAKGGRR
jgi:hypothetical protein